MDDLAGLKKSILQIVETGVTFSNLMQDVTAQASRADFVEAMNILIDSNQIKLSVNACNGDPYVTVRRVSNFRSELGKPFAIRVIVEQ